MRCVGVSSAFVSPSRVAVQRRSPLLHFTRTDLSKISEALSRALLVEAVACASAHTLTSIALASVRWR
jgi:hypothetical protein